MQVAVEALFGILALVGLWYGLPTLFRSRSSKRLVKLVAERRAIALTYDDGPSETLTPALLDLLERRGVPATFFLIGREAELRPGTVRRLLNDRHEIGNHTMDHLNAWKSGPFAAVRDIRSGQRQLAGLGAQTALFRPPFGKSTLLTLISSLRQGQRLAFWTHDSRDSWNRLPVEQVLDQIESAGGAVLLMHDFDLPKRGPSPEVHQDYVLRLTEAVIDFAQARGFSLIRLSDLFGNPSISDLRENT